MVQVPFEGLQSTCTYRSESFRVVLFGKIYFTKQKGQQNSGYYNSRDLQYKDLRKCSNIKPRIYHLP
jgi:hypothetical protein